MSVAIQPQAVQASTQVSTLPLDSFIMDQQQGSSMPVEASSYHPVEASSYHPLQEDNSWMYTAFSSPAPEGTDVYLPTRPRHAFFVAPYPASARVDPAPQVPPVDEPAPPQEAKTKQDMGGQWMYNSGWTGEAHPCLLGWLFVQGWFDWGACLTWHVQRSHVIKPGSLHWQCWVWYKEKTVDKWRAYMLLTEDIPDSERETFDYYKAWMIHEEGDA